MKAKLFILQIGEGEDAKIGSLVFWHPRGFDSVEEGLKDLADGFREVVETRSDDICGNCGYPIPCDAPNFLENLPGATLSEAGGEFYQIIELEHGWEVGIPESFESQMNHHLVIVRQAEKVLDFLSHPNAEYVFDWIGALKVSEGVPVKIGE